MALKNIDKEKISKRIEKLALENNWSYNEYKMNLKYNLRNAKDGDSKLIIRRIK